MFESVLRIVTMVSKTSILLIGAAVLLLGVTLKSSGIKTTVSQPIPIENKELTGLNQILSQAQNLFKNTFKAPILTKGLVTGGKQLPCRGPNCLGIFQAKGTRTAFDPFTGQRLAIGGSTQFTNITGTGAAQFASNQARITTGGRIAADLTTFITGIKQQIGILESTNNVTL